MFAKLNQTGRGGGTREQLLFNRNEIKNSLNKTEICFAKVFKCTWKQEILDQILQILLANVLPFSVLPTSSFLVF